MSTNIDIPGLKLPEGARWRGDTLWFSDLMGGQVYRLKEGGQVELVTELDHPSGLGFSPDGKLVVAVLHPPHVAMIGPDGTETLGDLTEMEGVTSANDMCVDERGRAYIGVYHGDFAFGSLALVEHGKAPRAVANNLSFPNGIVITPDNSTLLIAETYAHRISAFDIDEQGELSNRRVWAHLIGAHLDGLCLDAEGAVWVASWLEGEFLRVQEGGEVTHRIAVPGRWALSCALGGVDGRTLFTCSAETSEKDFAAGRSVGYLDTHRVDVPGVERP